MVIIFHCQERITISSLSGAFTPQNPMQMNPGITKALNIGIAFSFSDFAPPQQTETEKHIPLSLVPDLA